MAIRYCYIVAEGPQDIEFLSRLLKLSCGLKTVLNFQDVDRFWHRLVPRNFPINNELKKRVPVPEFLQGDYNNNKLSIALHSALGIDNLLNRLEETFAVIPTSQLFSVALFLDADDQQTCKSRFDELVTGLISKQIALSLPTQVGEVTENQPRFGVFIFPNNNSPGTLEDLLIDCARQNYPNLLSLATDYVNAIDQSKLNSKDKEQLNKPAGTNKAIISSISSILKPGKTIQVSIQDNRWIDQQTIQLNSVSMVKAFLDKLVNL